jgi:anaerobic selenocysteine-containing dehydrogenase
MAPTTAPTPPPLNSYALRLVATRKLYDQATFTQQSPSLAPLAPGATVRVNPAELEQLGVSSGDQVRISSTRGAQIVAAVADPSVPRRVAVVWFNQPGVQAGDLIDATQPVTDVRLETVRPGEQ